MIKIKLRLNFIRSKVKLQLFLIKNLKEQKFRCPVCNFYGPFASLNPPSGFRKHAKCPRCGALERHRIQYIVINNLLKDRNIARLRMLHFAPEPFFRRIFQEKFDQYETADLYRDDVDHKADLRCLPFENESYDLIFASHVLEHILEDKKAILEIRRILRPNGIAILPVPLVSEKTIEYMEPNPAEDYHVRAPGQDYFEKYDEIFSRVETFCSEFFPVEYQLYIYEDRSKWPTEECPLRSPMSGEKHSDVVPVCYV